MMNIQEREEMDYNPQSELQNAFAQSQMEIQRHDPKIDEAVARGKHVVVAHVPAFCPRTDAAMGEVDHYESEHDDQDTAKQAKAALEAQADQDGCDEIYWTITSPSNTAAMPPDNDNIPF